MNHETLAEHLVESTPSGLKIYKGFTFSTPFVPGRREFFRYRDLGVQEASGGRARAVINMAIAGMTEPTGWHYHECEYQFIYCIAGTAILEIDDGTVATFIAGDSYFLPGGVRHNEIYLSADRVSLEFSSPGVIGTVNVERPSHLPEILTPVGDKRT